MSDIDFTTMLSDAGMPTTEDEMQERWDKINTDEGSYITNDSTRSPFWRLVSAIVTAPCKWLVSLLVKEVLPNAFMKTAGGVWLELLCWAVNVTKKDAVAAVGNITFTRESSAGELTISAGTVVESPSINGYVYRLTAVSDVVCPDGTLTFDVAMQAEQTGEAYNLGEGYYSILPVAVSGIASVTNDSDWLTTYGADEESDDELRLRGRNQFSAVGQYHHDAAYKADIASFAGIRTDYLYFEHDAPRGAGSANCYIMLGSGAPSQEFVDTINAHVTDSGNHGHGDDMVCYPIPETSHDLSVTVWPVTNLTETEEETLRQSVEDMVRGGFRENSDYDVTQTLPNSRFSFSLLARELHQEHENLASVEFSLDDIVSAIELPALGTLTVSLGE